MPLIERSGSFTGSAFAIWEALGRTPYAASRVELKREYACVLSGLRVFLWAEIYCGFGG